MFTCLRPENTVFLVTRAGKSLEATLVLSKSTSPVASCSNTTQPSMRRQAWRGARARETCPTPLPIGASEAGSIINVGSLVNDN